MTETDLENEKMKLKQIFKNIDYDFGKKEVWETPSRQHLKEFRKIIQLVLWRIIQYKKIWKHTLKTVDLRIETRGKIFYWNKSLLNVEKGPLLSFGENSESESWILKSEFKVLFIAISLGDKGFMHLFGDLSDLSLDVEEVKSHYWIRLRCL